MDSWKRFDETLLPHQEVFYSSLNKEDIADVDHRHAKRVFKKFNNKNLNDYHIMICMFKLIHYCLQICLRILETNVLNYMK